MLVGVRTCMRTRERGVCMCVCLGRCVRVRVGIGVGVGESVGAWMLGVFVCACADIVF